MGICCINCFQDDYIIKIIKENEEKGDCEYCGSEDTCCMDTFELTDIFSPLMEIYEETTYGEHYGYDSDPNNYGGLLEDLIQEDWTIFSEGLDGDKAKNLLWDILSLEGDPDNPVDRYNLYSRYNGAFTHVEYDKIWDEFCQEIKFKKRFFHQYSWQNDLSGLLDICSIKIKEGNCYYRARITEAVNSKDPIPVHEMGAPPKEKSKNNRGNPAGIVYLYCATNIETAIAEVRPWKTAKISVATVEVNKELSVVDLRQIPYLDTPFGHVNLRRELEGRALLRRLSKEMSKPVDPSAAGYEYAPTQYLCELVNYLGFNGVIFNSSLGSGANIIVFDTDNVKILDSRLYTLNKIDYSF